MKPLKLYKILFSYLFPFTLESAMGKQGIKLNLFLKNGKLSLQAPHAVYSDQADYTSFRKAFNSINLERKKPLSVLILGFGLGSIANILKQNLQYIPQITGVEHDPQVVHWAKQYGRLEHIDLQVSDVVTYIQKCNNQYDLICMDIYVDQVVPEKCWTEKTLKQLKKLIAPQGILLFSTLEMKTMPQLKIDFEYRFKIVFPDYEIIDTGGNLVYYWQNKP